MPPYQNRNSGNFYAIGDINYYLDYLNSSINNSIFNVINNAGAFINFKPGINLTSAILDIENQVSGVKFSFAPQLNIHFYLNDFYFLASTGQINLNVLVSFIIIAVIILFFIQFQITERKREIYTERAIGMKLNQLAYVFYIENMILTVISLVIGFLVGLFLVEVINFVTQNPYQGYPRNVTFIPFNIVFLTNILVLLLTLIFSIIPIIYVVKQDISDSFGGEY